MTQLAAAIAVSGIEPPRANPTAAHQSDERLHIAMQDLPSLPVNVEGAFVASVQDVMIVAGGVRPFAEDRLPGAGDFVGTIHYLPVNATAWIEASARVPMAFGATAATPDGLICAGGIGPNGLTAQVIQIVVTVDKQGAVALTTRSLPDLPVPTAFAGGCVKNGKLHVIGGITSIKPVDANARHVVLELPTDKSKTPVWSDDGDVPSLANIVAPVVGVRRDDTIEHDVIYMAGGWQYDGIGQQFAPLGKAWKFSDKTADTTAWVEVSAPPSNVVFRSGMPLGPSHWLLFGRIDPGTRSSVARLCSSPRGMTGFFTYHTFTDGWVELPWKQEMNGVALAGRGKGFVVVGTQEPGATGGAVMRGELEYKERHFTTLDFVVMGVYMVSLVLIGLWCSRKEDNTTEFFLGSRNIPWWAAGLSMYATGISAISFMAIPAKTYATNWVRLGEPLIAFFSMMAAGYIFVPLLRRLELTTIMEYQELRFNKVIRFLSSFLAVAGQIAGRMGVVLLLPSVALAAVTGMNVYACVLFMGVVATLYTVLGGIRAVIWTDVLQFFVLFGGALLCFLMIVANVDGGLSGVLTIGQQYGKFHTFDFSWDITTVTVWVVMLWGIGDVMSRLGQDNMQRAFATKDAGDARRAMITCAVVSVPGALLFFAIGAALFVFYHLHPQFLNPTLDTDSVLPLFVAQQLPAGIGGLVIAGLFAAAMSTLDSAMNGVATIITRDWYSVFHINARESTRLLTARVLTVVCGALGTLMALYMASLGVRSLWDAFARMMGLITGALAGVMALALLTKRANWLGVLFGAVVNLLLLNWIRTSVHFLVFGMAFTAIGFVAGYVFSLITDALLPEDLKVRWKLKKDLTGLTIWTPR